LLSQYDIFSKAPLRAASNGIPKIIRLASKVTALGMQNPLSESSISFAADSGISMNRTVPIRDDVIYLGNDFMQMRAPEVIPAPPPPPLIDTPPPLIIDTPPHVDEFTSSDSPDANSEPAERDDYNDGSADA
jgi:hypothetical protein